MARKKKKKEKKDTKQKKKPKKKGEAFGPGGRAGGAGWQVERKGRRLRADRQTASLSLRRGRARVIGRQRA